jgi:hypothetical protein
MGYCLIKHRDNFTFYLYFQQLQRIKLLKYVYIYNYKCQHYNVLYHTTLVHHIIMFQTDVINMTINVYMHQ